MVMVSSTSGSCKHSVSVPIESASGKVAVRSLRVCNQRRGDGWCQLVANTKMCHWDQRRVISLNNSSTAVRPRSAYGVTQMRSGVIKGDISNISHDIFQDPSFAAEW